MGVAGSRRPVQSTTPVAFYKWFATSGHFSHFRFSKIVFLIFWLSLLLLVRLGGPRTPIHLKEDTYYLKIHERFIKNYDFSVSPLLLSFFGTQRGGIL